MKKELIENTLIKYSEKFGELPPIPMLQCTGERDPQYIKMLMNALRKNKKVTMEDISKYFPSDPDVLY